VATRAGASRRKAGVAFSRQDPWLLRVDRQLGDLIKAVVCRQHQRRLKKNGWANVLDVRDAGWASGSPPPRQGNLVDILIDGAAALPAIAEQLAAARSHIHITGLHLAPEFALTRDAKPVVLRNLLGELAERVDVRVLLWAGAPLSLFRPSRRAMQEVRQRLCAGTRIRCGLDDRERPLHCHHEKTIVIDDQVAFVGGIDLTTLAGDRFDTTEHRARARVGWHDVAARIAGPAVADVADHFRMRWHEVTREQLAPSATPKPAGHLELQVVRTVPERIYRALPRGDFRLLESYIRALRSATRLIYIENQFLWSPEITEVLRDKLLRPPTEAFRLLVVLPVKPNNGADDTRGVLGELVDADANNGRLLACTLYARAGRLADPIYVHAKIAIVDDEWLTLGSANLNEHSLFNDTEMNLVIRNSDLARQVRIRLWSEHLELAPEQLNGPPADIIEQHWKPISQEQLARLRAHQPLTHRLVKLPHVSRRSEQLLGPLNGLIVDG
jgi:phosphatidylserine/phosphatidylglycerophosphate/cardiolipin synthase-like enzyme